MTKSRAIIELAFAGALWGFGFVATLWGLNFFSPLQFLWLRFLIAWLGGEILYPVFFRKSEPSRWLQEFRLGAPVGIWIALALVLQTFGLQFTTATQSGFITTLYVIFVPLFQHFIFRKKQPWSVFFFAFLALGGTFILAGGTWSQLNEGDVLTLACSAAAALHIIFVGRILNRSQSSFRFNTAQTLVCLLAVSALLPMDSQPWQLPSQFLPWFGLIFTSVGSTLIAFTIQMRAQKVVSPSTASMLFLLESPFAFIFGFIFLDERLNSLQMAGAALILSAAVLTVRAETLIDSREKKSR